MEYALEKPFRVMVRSFIPGRDAMLICVFTVKYQLLVYLIGYDIQIVTDGDVGQFLQCFPFQYASGGIIGEIMTTILSGL